MTQQLIQIENIEKLQSLIKILEFEVNQIHIEDSPSFDDALALLGKTRKTQSIIEEKRREAKRRLDDVSRGVMRPLEECSKKLEDKIKSYAFSCEEIYSTFSDDDYSHPGIYKRRKYAFRAVNLEEVPQEYLCIDEAKVKQAIKMGQRHIEGLEIYEEESTVIRSG